MAVKIKLARIGKIREPFYRIVVADSRTARNGRAIELIGKYQPKLEPSLIEIDSERVQYWLGVGAQPTEPVLALLKVTGDWQKFKGLPGAEGTLKPQPEKVDKKARYDAAIAAIGGLEVDESAAQPKKKAAKKSAKKADDAKADGAKADDAKADGAKAEKTDAKADDAKADDAKADDAKAEKADAKAEKADDAKADEK